MIRRIVVMPAYDWLVEGWRKRSFSVAAKSLEDTMEVAGIRLVEEFHPVRVTSRLGSPAARAEGFDYGPSGRSHTYAVVAECDDEDAVERLGRERGDRIVGLYADPRISAFPAPYCGSGAVGGVREVETQIGVRALRDAGLRGRKVRVVVMDTGIDGSRIKVAGGWAPDPQYVPGSAPLDHGTMVAFDAKIAAPDAEILDYALLTSGAEAWSGFLSDAIAGYADLLQRIQNDKRPLVVNNSWGMYDRSDDAPIGSPENYAANPDHPFNQIVASLVGAGADVFFAAGNCGTPCASGRCGTRDRGPGASIHGANSHPDVVTVAAVTVKDARLGYSSQGPGAIAARKPDLAASSHFKGSGVYAADTGTSAASPVAAGVAAALRQKLSDRTKFTPGQLKGLLQRSARDINQDGWDADLGYGVVHAPSALRALGVKPVTKRAAKPAKKPRATKRSRARSRRPKVRAGR
ncbi:MAG TPA: S8 family serine peptidase [Candidatus Eisenbacteria bacterium]|nr:S8 family serine peptidase [Candidatus Eisenbacteria bacterium]